MARTDMPQTDATPAVAFEVERFAWTGDDRIEVAGRWFGLRGHRFMRPSLVVDAGQERRRLLALLEHKPWAADDGELWVAAFAWEGDPVDVTAAELAVAPSVAVELPAAPVPGGRGRSKGRAGANGARTGPRIAAHSERRTDALRRELRGVEAEVAELRADRERALRTHRADVTRLRDELAAERAALEQARCELERLAGSDADAGPAAERDAAVHDRDEARAALRTRDDALAAARAALGERDDALAAAHAKIEKRDGELTAARRRAEELRAQRDELATAAADAPPPAPHADSEAAARAERERDVALRERDALARRLDAALRERDAGRRERNDWISQADAATAARDAAIAARDAAAGERDALAAERDAAIGERDAAVAERDAAVAGRGADASERGAAAEPSVPRPGPRGDPAERTRPPATARARATAAAGTRRVGGREDRAPRRSAPAVWAPRVVALAPLVILVVVLFLLLRGTL
jgi:hypothetical protein